MASLTFLCSPSGGWTLNNKTLFVSQRLFTSAANNRNHPLFQKKDRSEEQVLPFTVSTTVGASIRAGKITGGDTRMFGDE